MRRLALLRLSKNEIGHFDGASRRTFTDVGFTRCGSGNASRVVDCRRTNDLGAGPPQALS